MNLPTNKEDFLLTVRMLTCAIVATGLILWAAFGGLSLLGIVWALGGALVVASLMFKRRD